MSRWFLLFVLLLFFTNDAAATTYYFSSVSGDDKRTSVEARNPETPWQSLKKLNTIFRSLLPGDSVLFKKGEVFYGSIELSASGTRDRPILLGAYGKGPMPIITSLVDLEQWKQTKEGVFEATHVLLGPSVNVVIIDGSMQEMGRYPNSASYDKGYFTFEQTNSENSVTDRELPHDVDFLGAELVIRKSRWTIDRHKIRSVEGGTIVFEPVSGTYNPVKNHGYFIQNHPSTLDEKGEWYFDAARRRLMVYFGKEDSVSSLVQASTLDNLVSNKKPVEFLVMSGLHFKGANGDAISIHDSNNITVQRCHIEYSGINGVNVINTSHFQLITSKVSYSLNNGVDLKQNTPYAKIYDNLVECTNVFPGMGQSGNANGVAIQASSDHNLIEQNKVINTGYNGIRFSGDSTVIKNNLVDNFCLIKDDGAGIYTWTGSSKAVNAGRQVIGNIVINGKGMNEGTPSAKASKPPAEGIYIDDYASGIEIRDNTVANVNGKGIFIHNARDLMVRNNTLYNNGHQIFILQDASDHPTRNNVIKGNTLISPHPGQANVTIRTNQDDVPLLATFEENRHVSYARSADVYIHKVSSTGLQIGEYVDLAGWQSDYPNSDILHNSLPLKSSAANQILSPNLLKNGNFDVNAEGSHCFSSADECTGEWVEENLLDGGSLKVDTKGQSFLLMGFEGAEQDKTYLLRFSALANRAMGMKVFLRQSDGPYHPISESHTVLLGEERAEYELVFAVAASERRGVVVFEAGPGERTSYWLDNIGLHEAEVSEFISDQHFYFAYNHSPEKVQRTLTGHYRDITNKAYHRSINLQPYSSAILWKGSERD